MSYWTAIINIWLNVNYCINGEWRGGFCRVTLLLSVEVITVLNKSKKYFEVLNTKLCKKKERKTTWIGKVYEKRFELISKPYFILRRIFVTYVNFIRIGHISYKKEYGTNYKVNKTVLSFIIEIDFRSLPFRGRAFHYEMTNKTNGKNLSTKTLTKQPPVITQKLREPDISH